jgi:hypothetical protein
MLRAKEAKMIEPLARYGEKTKDRNAQVKAIPHAESWGWLPTLSLTSASGLLLLALADSSARLEFEWAPVLMYAGLLALFVPVAARLLSDLPWRRERIGLIVILGLSLYLVSVLRSPIAFTGFDELLHWRTAHDIIQSGHLFSQNSLLPISPLYPGLEIVTSAVIRLTGLPIFEAGILVAGVARLLLVLALFLFFEEIGGSARVGGIATLLYMTNPSFVFFDAQYSYESLALPIGVFGLFLIARRLRRHETHRGATFASLLILGVIVVVHHLTSFAFVAFLILLAMIKFFTKQSAEDQSGLGWIVVFGIATLVAWLLLIASPVVDYLAPYTIGAVRQMIGLILNEVTVRTLFTDYAGQATPLWERAISFGSVALILLGLPWGLIQIWRRYRGRPVSQARGAASLTYTQVVEYNKGGSVIALALGVASLAYGVTLPLRLIPGLTEVAARSSEFLFLAIAFVLAVGPVQGWLFGVATRKRVAAVTLWAVILFLGGFILGAGPPWARLPGPYLVSADMRSIEPEGIAATNWVLAYLGPGNRVAADRINGLLMGSFGLQRPVTHISDGVDISLLYFSPDFGKAARAILVQGNIRYVVVDHRLSTGLPRLGVYFESGEPNSFQHKTPIPPAALAKFDQVENVSRVFDSGDIVIYDTGVWNGQP